MFPSLQVGQLISTCFIALIWVSEPAWKLAPFTASDLMAISTIVYRVQLAFELVHILD